MILVDIFVPSVDKVYDFTLNENIVISVVIEEIIEMVGQKEKSQINGDISKLQLCVKSTKSILDKNKTLQECNIQTGESLILV